MPGTPTATFPPSLTTKTSVPLSCNCMIWLDEVLLTLTPTSDPALLTTTASDIVTVVLTVVVVPLTVMLPVTVRLSLTVTSEVVCPIDTAIPEASVAILRAPTALVIYEFVPSWYKCISEPSPILNGEESVNFKASSD